MSGCEALQSVQFVTVNEKRFAVIDAEDWEALVDWLEEVEDRQIVRKALEELGATRGDRKQALWPEWQTVAGELE
jgi:acyl carrier protein phosphodiesterase